MNKIIVALAAVGVLAACNSTPEQFVINGQLRGDIKDGTNVFLKTADSTRRNLIDIDTANVTNGQFSFTGTMAEPKLHYLFIDGVRGNSPLIVENGEITMAAHKDSLGFSETKGTLQNELFMSFIEESRTLASMSTSMSEDFRKAAAEKDTATVQALREEYMELQEKAKNFELDFIKKNPNALVSVMLLEKVLTSKVVEIKEAQKMYDALTDEIKGTEPGKLLEEQLKKGAKTAIGAMAPTFSGPTPTGETLALNDVKGKLTLIDFWAAWCKPCRMENPNIVAVYNKYKDKGLQVVGVSLDRKKEDWLAAIESDGLAWNHVSNLAYFNDPIARAYSINSIPAAFLIDENGVIIAKNLRGAALEKKVAELLN